MAAQLEIVKGGAQFEQRRALAAGQLGRRGEPCCACIRIGMSVGANPQQFSVVKVLVIVVGLLEGRVEVAARFVTLASGNKPPRADSRKPW